MAKGLITRIGLIALIATLMASAAFARTAPGFERNRGASPTTAVAAYGNVGHDIGKLVMAVANDGTFGLQLGHAGDRDWFTGEQLQACEYPKGSRTRYLFAGDFWVGAVLGRDTLVSTGADGWDIAANEFHPDELPLGELIYRSNVDPSKPEFDGAISEQDYIAVYYDTCLNCAGVTADAVDNRPHRPLNLEVTQRSFAWSYEYADDFVLFDYAVKNIGTDRLRRVYLGIYVDADIHALAAQDGAQDDLCGFYEKAPARYLEATSCPPDSDVVNVAWTIDNDGDLAQTMLPQVPNVTAMRIVRTPAESLQVSFNWWISNGASNRDFGPQSRAKQRDLGHGGLGTPSGDRNKYHYLTNGEFDYDQAKTATISDLDPVWLPPPDNFKNVWPLGLDTRYLLSFGPFDIEPGQTLPVSFAYVGGEYLHSSVANYEAFDANPTNWQAYYDGLNFDSLGVNATWADWIYDNPGVDTDSDGYAGVATICWAGGDSTLDSTVLVVDSGFVPWDSQYVEYWSYDVADTVWRKGDGVPDFQGASPPPAPAFYTSSKGIAGLRVEPSVGKIRVLWNGVRSENAKDIFSREKDFEGYRVYLSRDDRRSSFSLIQSYDIEDYNKWVYDTANNVFALYDTPFLLEEARALYGGGNPDWHPLDHPRTNPLRYVGIDTLGTIYDSTFYFEGQDFNRSILGSEPDANTQIRKVYPDAPYPPSMEPDSISDEDYDLHVTEEGFLKYFEYEYTIENLLPTVPYWINITAFDYGSPSSGLPSLETNPTVGPVTTYALESVDKVLAEDMEVFVYPNPYRIDADYRERGFEGRGQIDRPADRTRAIHFANLPPKCKISIYTIDGDLVREIQHDVAEDDPLANHEIWDMITRNTQAVVSGIYYWTVESDYGETQVGKLVIIM
ncbi:MAG: hypothetical protein KKA42_13815 [candidate division Zixibacteria bacterium]|nr:hypothetical protein [candidate division Zixibacteria bacterium]